MSGLRIESYSFGKIRVDGVDYTDDVIVLRDRVISPWWRKAGGHLFAPSDLEDVIAARAEVVVLGLGAYGVVKVDPAAEAALSEAGSRVVALESGDAVAEYNRLVDAGEDAIAALHLTC
jgi:hypothetical protein